MQMNACISKCIDQACNENEQAVFYALCLWLTFQCRVLVPHWFHVSRFSYLHYLLACQWCRLSYIATLLPTGPSTFI